MKLFKRKNENKEVKGCACEDKQEQVKSIDETYDCSGKYGDEQIKLGSSCCSFSVDNIKDPTAGASVKILGSGCTKCNILEKNTFEALKELNMNTTIDHVTDFSEIASYGVMSTPALYVDGKIVAFGKVFSKEEIMKILQKVRG